MRIKRLKDQSGASVRKAIEYLLHTRLNKWITPRRMQAYMWSLTAEVTEEEVRDLMEDIYLESLDCPWKAYTKNNAGTCYKCIAFSIPK